MHAPPAIEEATEMKILESKFVRAAGTCLPLLMTGCAIVPDGGAVYSSGYRVPAYSANYSSGYYTTYGPGYYPRPPAPPVYISRPAPPPAIIVRPAPAPVVVLPAHRPPAYGYRGGDRSYGHGRHGGYGGHDGHRGDGDHGRGGR